MLQNHWAARPQNYEINSLHSLFLGNTNLTQTIYSQLTNNSDKI